MASDLSQPASAAPPAAAPPAQTKVRIRFRKDGDLRFVSHHDLMKVCERMFRRAALPVAQTKGFHPSPRMAFALSLALGIVGCEEVLELLLDAILTPEEVRQALTAQAPPGLTILSVRAIDRKLTAQVRAVTYRVALSGKPQTEEIDVASRIKDLLAAGECWVERTRPHRRRLDVRPLLRAVRLLNDHLEIDLWVTPTGGVRPEEVLGLLGLTSLLEAGATLERTRLELHDETQEPGPVPQVHAIREDDQPAPEGPSQRPTALLPGPLSFDS
jgi:radical SAM-linked protein